MRGWELVYWIVTASLIVEVLKRPFNYGVTWLWEFVEDWHFHHRLRSGRWEIRGGQWIRRKR